MTPKILIRTIWIIGLILASMNTFASDDKTININQDWQYLQENHANVSQALNSKNWQPIQLPHTWNRTDTVDAQPGYRRDASWYKKRLELSNAKRQFLYFEGANTQADVYVNGKLAGTNIGGYIGFTFEITDYVNRDKIANIMVRVSNAYNPDIIPSQKSDFFIFGGLTRDVWLIESDDVYLENLTVTTPKVSHELVEAVAELNFDSTKSYPQSTLVAEIFDPTDKMISKTHTNIAINQGAQSLTLALNKITNPALWSVDSPDLYRVKVTLSDNDRVLASKEVTTGFRWFEHKEGKGFFLNGERVLLRGTHRHEEHAGFGAALSNIQHRKDLEQIKNIGANFVRLGHYPQDPEVYKAANELGLIVWDELPWCRGGKGGETWEANTESLLTRQIQQNRNHPSIAFWSIGNEMYWEEDFPGGGAEDVVTPYVQKLNDLIKDIDPSRFTTLRKYYPGADIVDIFSPSIWAGWYGGAYGQYEEALQSSMEKYPALIHMEYGGSSHVGRHEESPIDELGIRDAQVSVSEAMNQAIVKSVAKDSNWNENYMVNLFDWHLSVSERFPGFIGNAQWAFKDFGTPLRPENPIPYVNQKGLVDRAGNPKDSYYVFASYWQKTPMCYIESKTWTVRYGPKAGRNVKVYCNTEQAELYLNGETLGKKDRIHGQYPAHGLVWKVPFSEGKNQLYVKGFNDGNMVIEDSLALEYQVGTHDKPKKVALSSERVSENLYLVTASIIDSDGRLVTDYEDRGYFSSLDSNAKLIENQGTPNGSSSIELANGMARILVQKTSNAQAVIEFKTQNFKGQYVRID
ncbi:glycoside hydrolase family 2 protein [Thalassotalea litorea]|uniref:glycoside hydrolase family 2 protein n=1 Tax=Thalassotalea litorea TaxID=2020715 RepID=UPI003736DC97